MYTDVENGCVDTERGMNQEFGTDIYTLPCVKQIASGKLLCSTRSSAWCSVMTHIFRDSMMAQQQRTHLPKQETYN